MNNSSNKNIKPGDAPKTDPKPAVADSNVKPIEADKPQPAASTKSD